MNRCSFVMMHKETSEARTENLISIVRYIVSLYTDPEIFIIEQDEYPRSINKIKHLPVKYHFLFNEDDYNKSWALNFGAKQSKRPMIIFHDNDIVVPKDGYDKCLKQYGNFDVMSPYDKCHNLDELESHIFHTKLKYFQASGPSREGNDSYVNVSGGVMFIRRCSFEQIGGWDERFIGYGGEDNEMNDRIKKCLRTFIYSGKANHLYHEKASMEHLGRNDVVWSFLQKQSREDILENAKRMYPGYGREDKYAHKV